MSDLDPDSIITVRWSALNNPPVKIEILSYAHHEDLLGEITALVVLHGPAWKVRLEGPRIYLTVETMHCKAVHQFAKTLIADYGCTYAHALRMASKHH